MSAIVKADAVVHFQSPLVALLTYLLTYYDQAVLVSFCSLYLCHFQSTSVGIERRKVIMMMTTSLEMHLQLFQWFWLSSLPSKRTHKMLRNIAVRSAV